MMNSMIRRIWGRVYNKLGVIAHHRGNLDEAKKWYLKSLKIEQLSNNFLGMQKSYINLALLEMDCRKFEEADKFCENAIEIGKEVGATKALGNALATRLMIKLANGDCEGYILWAIRALVVFASRDETNKEAIAILDDLRTRWQKGLFDIDLFERVWRQETGNETPKQIIDIVVDDFYKERE
jgi:tetratricopeptide (TPR) repeat protein